MLNEAVRAELEAVAAKHKVPAHNLMAVVEIESAGIVFWNVNGKQVPAARPEGHYFYARLRGEERQRAVAQGLASPNMGGTRVPAARADVYKMIGAMMAINENAAIESCSWGLGQVMGANWKALGYSSPKALYDECQSGLSGQVECMMKFIITNDLAKALRNGDFTTFAARYNGPAYRVNAYDTKMANAAARYAALPKVAIKPKMKTTAKQEAVAITTPATGGVVAEGVARQVDKMPPPSGDAQTTLEGLQSTIQPYAATGLRIFAYICGAITILIAAYAVWKYGKQLFEIARNWWRGEA